MGRSSTILITTTGLSWGNYGGYAFGYIDGLNTHGHSHGRDRFAADARAGTLPTVSYVYAIAEGGLWDSVAIFISWDDWGGWYDHVDPPAVENWDHTHARHG